MIAKMRKYLSFALVLILGAAIMPSSVFAASNTLAAPTIVGETGVLKEIDNPDAAKQASYGIRSIQAYPGISDGSYYPSLGITKSSVPSMYLSVNVPQNILDTLGSPTPGVYEGWWGNTSFTTPSNATRVTFYVNGDYYDEAACAGGTTYNFGFYFMPVRSNGNCELKIEARTSTGSTIIVGYSRVLTYN